VRFSQPVISYNENFLNFPVDTGIPLGAYNRELGVWIASDNGTVIKIVNITEGLAELDTTETEQLITASPLALRMPSVAPLPGCTGGPDALASASAPLYQTLDCNMAVMCDEPCDVPKSESPFEKGLSVWMSKQARSSSARPRFWPKTSR